MLPTCYERYAYLYSFCESYYGHPAYLEYLPAPRSRKWRRSSLVYCHSKFNFERAVQLMQQEGWDSIRFVPTNPEDFPDDFN